MRIRLFGELQIDAGGNQSHKLPTQKCECLLGFLAYFKGQWQSREQLAEMFWPSALPESARQSLRTAIFHLRHALNGSESVEPVLLEANRFHVRLNTDALQTDVDEFLKLSSRAVSAAPLQRCAILKEACQLFQGPLLSRFYDDWIISERAVLDDLLLNNFKLWSQTAAHLGDFTEAILAAQQLIKLDRYDHSSYLRLIELFRQTGRLDRALLVAQSWDLIATSDLNDPNSDITAQMFALARKPLTVAVKIETPVISTVADYAATVPAVFAPFFGRQDDLASLLTNLNALSDATRIVQLIGPAGVGKTRLAIEACRQSSYYAENRVLWLNLAELTTVNELINQVCAALNLPGDLRDPYGQIRHIVESQRLLLVFDGIDGLLETNESTFLDVIATLAPNSGSNAIVTTARQVFQPGKTTVMRVHPLPVPRDSEQEWTNNPCIQIVLDRAGNRFGGSFFVHSEKENLRTIARLCRQLEGLPFCLELAAGWAGCLTISQIAARFRNPLDVEAAGVLVRDESTSTLRSVIAHSVDMLPDNLREICICLSIFPAGCNIESLAQVCYPAVDDHAVHNCAGLVAALIERSLVYSEIALDEMRYKQLECVREHIAGLLSKCERLPELKLNMLRWACNLAARCSEDINKGDEITGIQRLLTERPNLEAMLQWSFKDGQSADIVLLGTHLAIRLSVFWQITGSLPEGKQYLLHALQKASDMQLQGEHVEILTELAEICVRQGLVEESIQYAKRALEWAQKTRRVRCEAKCTLTLARGAVKQNRHNDAIGLINDALKLGVAEDDGAIEAQCYNNLGIIAYNSADYEVAKQHYNRALEIWHILGVQRGIAGCLQNIGLINWLQGDHLAAQLRYTEAREAWEHTNDLTSMAACLLNLGSLECDGGNYENARTWMEKALKLARRLGDSVAIANSLNNLGVVLIELSQHLEAARYLEEASQLYDQAGNKLGAAFCKYNMGLIYYERRETRRATALLLQSLELRINTGDKRGVVESLELLCAASAEHVNDELMSAILTALRTARQELNMPLIHRRSHILDQLAIAVTRSSKSEHRSAANSRTTLTLDMAAEMLVSEIKNPISDAVVSTN